MVAKKRTDTSLKNDDTVVAQFKELSDPKGKFINALKNISVHADVFETIADILIALNEQLKGSDFQVNFKIICKGFLLMNFLFDDNFLDLLPKSDYQKVIEKLSFGYQQIGPLEKKEIDNFYQHDEGAIKSSIDKFCFSNINKFNWTRAASMRESFDYLLKKNTGLLSSMVKHPKQFAVFIQSKINEEDVHMGFNSTKLKDVKDFLKQIFLEDDDKKFAQIKQTYLDKYKNDDGQIKNLFGYVEDKSEKSMKETDEEKRTIELH